MATIVAKTALPGAAIKAVHAGANVVRGHYVASTTHSAGDVIQMVKVPNGAIVDDVVVIGSSIEGSSPGVVNFTVGDGADPNRYASVSQALTTAVRATTGLGYQYSVSDDAAVRYDTIDLTHVSGTVSVGQAIDVIVTYHVDQ